MLDNSNKKDYGQQDDQNFHLPKGSMYAPLPIPAFQVLAAANEFQAQRVLLALVLHMGKNDNCVWPSYTRIASSVGMSRASISKGLKILKEYEFIYTAYYREGKKSRRKYYIQQCCWDSSMMKSLAKKQVLLVAKCTMCLKYLGGGDFSMVDNLRVHWGCGGYAIRVKPFNFGRNADFIY